MFLRVGGCMKVFVRFATYISTLHMDGAICAGGAGTEPAWTRALVLFRRQGRKAENAVEALGAFFWGLGGVSFAFANKW
jgi:hypothetical protein